MTVYLKVKNRSSKPRVFPMRLWFPGAGGMREPAGETGRCYVMIGTYTEVKMHQDTHLRSEYLATCCISIPK